MNRIPGISLLLGLAVAAPLSAQGFNVDFIPTAPEVVLDTDLTMYRLPSGQVIPIVGGTFVFRSVLIPRGTRVRGVGSNPLVFVVQQDVRIDGDLSVDGENGANVDTLNSANFPAPGGRGGPAGGSGGDGSPSTTARSATGKPGYGAFQIAGIGGGGGALGCGTTCNRGAGGGGGAFATQGDLDYLLGTRSWLQVRGEGGAGCRDLSLQGGLAGPLPFLDGREENDFFGVGVDLSTFRFVPGELPMLMGGEGGGGGGDMAPNCLPNDPNWISDAKGAGGGGGGGALLIASMRRVIVGPFGHVTANGGHGGGGEQGHSNNLGGGGGGGSGGMIVLLGIGGIELNVKGDTWRNGDADFVLSADGGIGRQGVFSGLSFERKYPRVSMVNNALPAGGFGGLGIIELVAPAGTNTDGTNTILDDGVDVVLNGVALRGTEKVRYLAWRGFQSPSGSFVDDMGAPTGWARGEGDMRPAPILLPLF
ncbi:MAG: hypothetical protein U1F36_06390 [Planctomycetota bacterium]